MQQRGVTALHLAAKAGSKECLASLVGAGACVNTETFVRAQLYAAPVRHRLFRHLCLTGNSPPSVGERRVLLA